MGTLERIKRAIEAEINYSSSNSEKIVSQNIKELEITIIGLRQSIAQASSAKKRIHEKYDYSISEIARWEKRAWLAVYANDDYLAKEALLRKRYFEQQAAELKIHIKSDRNTEIINNLRAKLTTLEMWVIELKLLETRQYSFKAQRILQTDINNNDFSSEMESFERMEEKVISLKALETESKTSQEPKEIDIVELFLSLEAEYGSDGELKRIKKQSSKGSSNSTEYVSDNIIDAELDELRAQLDN